MRIVHNHRHVVVLTVDRRSAVIRIESHTVLRTYILHYYYYYNFRVNDVKNRTALRVMKSVLQEHGYNFFFLNRSFYVAVSENFATLIAGSPGLEVCTKYYYIL